MPLLKQSSTAQPLVFLLVLTSDHISGATGLTPTVTLSKNGGAFASPSGAVTEIANGLYKVAGNATDTNTLGPLWLHATGTGADPVDMVWDVVAYDPQDAVHLGIGALPNTNCTTNASLLTSGTGTDQLSVTSGRVDIGKALGTAVTLDANNVLNVSTKYVGGTLQTARDLGASVLLSAGTGTGQLDFTSGVVKANLAQILGTALTETAGFLAAGFKKFFNVSATPASTMDHLTLLDTVTTVTNRVTANTDQWAGGTIPAPNVTGVPLTDLKYVLGTLSPATAGYIGIDWGHVNAATTVVDLTNTTIKGVDGVTFPATVASPTNITAGTITTVTNLTNAPTAGDFTATMKTSLNAATPTAKEVWNAFYVDAVNGNDNNGGTSWADAMQTLSTACTDGRMASGSYIFLAPGTYNVGQLTEATPFTGLTIQGADDLSSIITGSITGASAAVIIGKSNWSLRNLTVSNAHAIDPLNPQNTTTILLTNANDVRIENVQVLATGGQAISATGCQRLRLIDVTASAQWIAINCLNTDGWMIRPRATVTNGVLGSKACSVYDTADVGISSWAAGKRRMMLIENPQFLNQIDTVSTQTDAATLIYGADLSGPMSTQVRGGWIMARRIIAPTSGTGDAIGVITSESGRTVLSDGVFVQGYSIMPGTNTFDIDTDDSSGTDGHVYAERVNFSTAEGSRAVEYAPTSFNPTANTTIGKFLFDGSNFVKSDPQTSVTLAANQHVIADSLTTNNDKTGYGLAATGLDQISVADPGAPANMTTLSKMIVAVWRSIFGKSTLTATQLKTYADDGTTVNSTSTVSDDGTTQTKGKAA